MFSGLQTDRLQRALLFQNGTDMRFCGTSKIALPFGFDRSSRIGLAQQLADGFASAIRDGLYRKGDVLPSIKELSSALKVSEITVRGSLRRLVKTGLVSPRRGVGSVVTGDAGPLRRGRVLIVTTAAVNNFCHATIIAVLREELLRAGYLPNQISVVPGENGRPDFSQLDQLLGEGIALAVVFGTFYDVWKRIEARGVRCVVLGRAGTVHVDMAIHSALPEFAALCRSVGAMKVVVPRVMLPRSKYTGDRRQVVETLRAHGLNAELWNIRCIAGITPAETEYRSTYAAFASRYGRNGASLPDVFFLPEDHSAMAALHALDCCGIEMPRDVGFVSWSARGSFPFYRKSVTRLETDPLEGGRRFARLVLDFLAGRKIPPGAIIGSTLVRGETF